MPASEVNAQGGGAGRSQPCAMGPGLPIPHLCTHVDYFAVSDRVHYHVTTAADVYLTVADEIERQDSFCGGTGNECTVGITTRVRGAAPFAVDPAACSAVNAITTHENNNRNQKTDNKTQQQQTEKNNERRERQAKGSGARWK